MKSSSKYNQLNNEEKLKLFSNPSFSLLNGVTSKDLNFYNREKKGYDLLENFILLIGGGELKDRLVKSKDENIIENIGIGDFIKIFSQYKSKYKEGLVYSTGMVQCWDTFDWSDNKWLNCDGNRCYFQNLEIKTIPFVNSFYRTKITVYKLIKEIEVVKKGFFSKKLIKKQFVEEISLYPFIDNLIKEEVGYIIDEDKYDTNSELKGKIDERPLNFWKFIERDDFEGYLLNDKDIKVLKDLYEILNTFVSDIYKEDIEIPNKKKIELKGIVQNKIKKIILSEFDKDSNGELDILEGDNLIMDLLEKNESIIVDFDFNPGPLFR
jgi:hypothetical protein